MAILLWAAVGPKRKRTVRARLLQAPSVSYRTKKRADLSWTPEFAYTPGRAVGGLTKPFSACQGG